MVPLGTAQAVFTWLSLCSPDDNISETTKTINKVSSITVVILIFLGSMAGGVFFLTHMINDLGMALYALWLTISLSYGLYMYICLFMSRDKMKAMFKSLSDIYNASKYSKHGVAISV